MSTMKGIVASLLVAGNTIVACTPLFLLGLVRGVLQLLGLSSAVFWLAARMDLIVDFWVGGNRIIFSALGIYRDATVWEGDERLRRDRWYVAISNHQSWPDILILQTVMRRIPPLKFFTKRQLIWVPFIGIAMWLLGFPYVRRFSREQIAANPALTDLDRQATLKACEGFRNHPTTVLNFLEGTRFTPEKHARQAARFNALLNPKSGGLTLVLDALEDRLDCLVDVTIEYPHGTPTFWEFMKGECPEVNVLAQCREIPATVRAAAGADARRQAVETWIEDIWREKDARLRNRHEIAGHEATA